MADCFPGGCWNFVNENVLKLSYISNILDLWINFKQLPLLRPWGNPLALKHFACSSERSRVVFLLGNWLGL